VVIASGLLSVSAQQQGITMQGIVMDLVSSAPIPDAVIIFEGPAGYSRAHSDAAGRFVIPDVAPGDYKATVTHDGYYWSKSRSGPPVVSVTSDLRNVSFRLIKGLSISGRILDPNGEPGSGMAVRLWRLAYQNGIQMLTPVMANPNGVRTSSSTDRKGEYRLYGLEPGEYYLVTGSGDTLTYYPGTSDPGAAIPLRLVPGKDLSGVNMTQIRSSGFTVTVEVAQNPDPTATALGTIRSRNALSLQDVAGFRSIGNNRYTSAPMKPGQYEVIWTSPTTRLAGRVEFDIVDHDVDAGSIVLSPGITIEGRLKIPDSQVDLNRLQVRLNPVNGGAVAAPYGSSAADGSFSISNAFQGQYWFDLPALSRGVYRDLFVESVRYGAHSPERGDIIIGKTSEGLLEIVLAVGSTVRGTVHNARGEVVPFSSVLIYPVAGPQRPSYFKTAEADRNGAFTIMGVGAGEYRVLSWEDTLPPLYLDPKFLNALTSRATAISVRKGVSSSVDVRVVPADQ
jgi:5-hydroxyisourate hydrolase-like protein (transthyretin family)